MGATNNTSIDLISSDVRNTFAPIIDGDIVIIGVPVYEERIPEILYDFLTSVKGKEKPAIVNIFTHRFSSPNDVSDRVYYTSKEIIETFKDRFEIFLNKANEFINLKNIPMHVEVRVEVDKICPIEFNPMGFAGIFSTSDLYEFCNLWLGNF